MYSACDEIMCSLFKIRSFRIQLCDISRNPSAASDSSPSKNDPAGPGVDFGMVFLDPTVEMFGVVVGFSFPVDENPGFGELSTHGGRLASQRTRRTLSPSDSTGLGADFPCQVDRPIELPAAFVRWRFACALDRGGTVMAPRSARMPLHRAIPVEFYSRLPVAKRFAGETISAGKSGSRGISDMPVQPVRHQARMSRTVECHGRNN